MNLFDNNFPILLIKKVLLENKIVFIQLININI